MEQRQRQVEVAQVPTPLVGEPDPGASVSISCSVISLSSSHRHDHAATPLRGIYVTINDHLFKALCDTGAAVSFIDPIVTSQLNIATRSVDGIVSFATRDTQASRVGVTVPVAATITVFLKPVQTHDIVHSF